MRCIPPERAHLHPMKQPGTWSVHLLCTLSRSGTCQTKVFGKFVSLAVASPLEGHGVGSVRSRSEGC